MYRMWNDPEEMALRKDKDYIASLNMINEGGVAFEKTVDESLMESPNFNNPKN